MITSSVHHQTIISCTSAGSLKDFTYMLLFMTYVCLKGIIFSKESIGWKVCTAMMVSRGCFRLKLSPTFGRCPRWLIFFKNLFYQNNCKEAMSIGGGQIRSALFNFLQWKSALFCNFWTLPSVSKITLGFSINTWLLFSDSFPCPFGSNYPKFRYLRTLTPNLVRLFISILSNSLLNPIYLTNMKKTLHLIALFH